MRANGNRPVALERWPNGWREGMTMTVRPTGRQQQGDGFYSKRLPKGPLEWITTCRVTTPNGRPIDELCLTEPAAAVWAAQMGTLTFHPWAVRATDVEHPDELRIDLDPQDGATFRDVQRVAEATRELLAGLGMRGFAKTSGNRGIHVYLRIEPRYSFGDVRHAAIGLGRGGAADVGATTNWWKEERPAGSVFLDYNQNLRDRTVAGAWSLRPKPGRPSARRCHGRNWLVGDPHDFNMFTVAEVLADGDPWTEIDEVAHPLEPLLELWHERCRAAS